MKKITIEIFIAVMEGIIKSNADFYNNFYNKGDEEYCRNKILLNIIDLEYKVQKIKEELLEYKYSIISTFDNEFPLLEIKINNSERPYLLFYKGNIQLLTNYKKNVAVIGVLNPTLEIENRERKFIKHLVSNGCNILSGLAKGCDTIAHDECLINEGKTIAILPSTLKNVFPAENRELTNRIIQNDGLVITEYFNEPKSKFEAIKRFTDRDRLQALFSNSIILTASYRLNEGDSGSRHAMKKAKEYGKKRYVLYNDETDFNNPQFGLNIDYIKYEKDIKLLSTETIKEITESLRMDQWNCFYSPMLGDKLVFDLEGTLVFTDKLNTKCYNLTLQKYNFPSLNNINRITKEIIKKHIPEISNLLLNNICNEKQNLFLSALNEIILNIPLINILKSTEKQNIILYTRSNILKTEKILEYFKLDDYIYKIIQKTDNIEADIQIICGTFDCSKEQLVFFDDDIDIIKKLRKNGYRTFTN